MQSAAYEIARWAYQPIKHSVSFLRTATATRRGHRISAEYLTNPGFKGLHLGCGPFNLNGWLNSDLVGTPGIDIAMDLETSLPLPGGSFDAIYASEVVEHIRREKVLPLLQECFRVLKPGGVFRLTTPDIEAVCRLYVGSHPTSNLESFESSWKDGTFTPTIWTNYLFRAWGHQWLWDFASLSDALKDAGFGLVERVELQKTRSQFEQLNGLEIRYGLPAPKDRWASSMIVEATKI